MDEAKYIEVISGRRRGAVASVERGVLRGLSWGYRGIIRARNAYYDTWAMPTWLPVPVIAVGNITVGGTGKTPMTIWLCERLLERGRKPAVLSRGYKAEAGCADELLLVSRRVPQAVAVAHKDRRRAGELAVEEYGAQAAVLDDAFQHRKVGRDLDIVLIDATEPFGFGHVLPRGLLREPVRNLRRAEAIVITRCDQVEPAALARLEGELRRMGLEAPVAHAVHRPGGFVSLHGEAVEPPGGRIGAFAGIARPRAFVETLKAMGREPAETRWWPDHYAYGEQDVAELSAWARERRLDALVTTEKDAVKLARLEGDCGAPVAALRVDIDMVSGGDKIIEAIDRMLLEHSDESDGQHAEPQ